MFKWLTKSKKEGHSEECLENHTVSESKYSMISHKGKMDVKEISELLPEIEGSDESIGFYVESKCMHGHMHNNRILLWSEPNQEVLIEVQRPQDLCSCSSYYKTVAYKDFSTTMKDMSLVISMPSESGFDRKEWT